MALILNLIKSYMSQLYVSWGKLHVNLGSCSIEPLHRRLIIHNVLHNENTTVQHIAQCKLVSPTSMFANNY